MCNKEVCALVWKQITKQADSQNKVPAQTMTLGTRKQLNSVIKHNASSMLLWTYFTIILSHHRLADSSELSNTCPHLLLSFHHNVSWALAMLSSQKSAASSAAWEWCSPGTEESPLGSQCIYSLSSCVCACVCVCVCVCVCACVRGHLGSAPQSTGGHAKHRRFDAQHRELIHSQSELWALIHTQPHGPLTICTLPLLHSHTHTHTSKHPNCRSCTVCICLKQRKKYPSHFKCLCFLRVRFHKWVSFFFFFSTSHWLIHVAAFRNNKDLNGENPPSPRITSLASPNTHIKITADDKKNINGFFFFLPLSLSLSLSLFFFFTW